MTIPKVLGEVVITIKVTAIDTEGEAVVSNATADFTMSINGVDIPTWTEQQLLISSSSMPKWPPMSASLRNELRAWASVVGPERLVAMGILTSDI